MADWAEIQKHMRGAYQLQHDEPEMMSVVWAYEDGRTQKVVVRHYQSDGHSMVEFKSPFAKVGQVDPAILLQDSAQMTLATVAQSGDVYLAIYNVMIGPCPIETYDYILRRVAAVADALEEKYASGDTF